MNSFQRVFAALRGLESDRRAVSLSLSLYGSRLTGSDLVSYYSNPGSYVAGQSLVKKTFSPDIVFAPFYLAAEAEAFGCAALHSATQPPIISRPAISKSSQIDGLRFPDIDRDPYLGFMRESVRLLKAEHGTESPVAAVIGDPFSLAGLIMGLDNWLQVFLFEEAHQEAMLEMLYEFFVQYGNALLRDGATFLGMPVTSVNPKLLGREIVVRKIIPLMEKHFSRLQGPVILHHAGNPFLPCIDLLVNLPNVIGFIPDSRDDLDAIRNIIGPERVIIGGIDGPTLSTKTPQEIRALCNKVLANRRDDPHFILGMTASEIPLDTSSAQILAVMGAAKYFHSQGPT